MSSSPTQPPDLTKSPDPQVTTVNRRPMFIAGTLLLFAFLIGITMAPQRGGAPKEPPGTAAPPASLPNEERLSAFLKEQEQRAARARQAPPDRTAHTWSSLPSSSPSAATGAGLEPIGPASPGTRGPIPGTYDPDALRSAGPEPVFRPPVRSGSPSMSLVRFRANEPSSASSEADSSDPLVNLQTQLTKILPLLVSTGESASPRSEEPALAASKPAPAIAGEATPAALRLLPAPPPANPFVLFEGSLIPATLEADIVSDLPGSARALVRQDVFDSLTGTRLLIPQGSKLLGEYNSEIAYGASRLLLAWSRLILPDGTSYSLQRMPAADPGGASGLPGYVNNHWGRLLGTAALLSVVSAGAQLSQTPSGTDFRTAPTASEVAAAALGQELGSVSTSVMRRELQVAPTIRVQAGAPFYVQVTTDLQFPGPYGRTGGSR